VPSSQERNDPGFCTLYGEKLGDVRIDNGGEDRYAREKGEASLSLSFPQRRRPSW
jgi:hypothetical protein